MDQLGLLVPKFATLVVEDITSQCSKTIESVQTIPRLYRRTNKTTPSKPSAFVNTILKPFEERLRDFPAKYKQEWSTTVIEAVTENYYRVTSELLLSVKRTEDSLLKLNAYRRSSAPSSSGGMSDDNKIRLQVALDIENFTAQIASINSHCLQLTAVKQLLVMGQTSKSTALDTIQEH